MASEVKLELTSEQVNQEKEMDQYVIKEKAMVNHSFKYIQKDHPVLKTLLYIYIYIYIYIYVSYNRDD